MKKQWSEQIQMATRIRALNENENEKKNAENEKPTGIIRWTQDQIDGRADIYVPNVEMRRGKTRRGVLQEKATLDTEIAKTFSDLVSATILRLAQYSADCDSVSFLSFSRAENIAFIMLSVSFWMIYSAHLHFYLARYPRSPDNIALFTLFFTIICDFNNSFASSVINKY